MSGGLEITGLRANRGRSPILQGVDLKIRPGVSALVGRNGMGKTTLAETIMGIVRPTRGSIKIAGIELAGLPSHKVAKAGVALVPQGRRLFASLSVDEHLRMMERRRESELIWSREEVLDLFPRLGERLSHKGAELSGGEQQMLAVGRALMQGPQVLILDEPSEGLAPVVVLELGEAISMLGSSGLSVLLIEQNVELVAVSTSDDVLVMENGVISRSIGVNALVNDRRVREQVLGVALG